MARNAALLIQIQLPDGTWLDVGHIRNRDERNSFEILDSYWESDDRPVLGQVFEEHGRAWRPSSYTALPQWFSHLLPEGQLRDAVAQAAETSKLREFELLARLGQDDLPGAVRARPADPDTLAAEVPHAKESSIDDDNPLLKFSLAGLQMKFSVLGGRKGLTVPAKGVAGNVILKLPDGRPGFAGVPDAELGALQLGRVSGLDTADAWLVNVAEVAGLERWSSVSTGPALAVARFDRKESGRVHMEELAQVLAIPTAGQRAKYARANFETIASIVGALCGIEMVGQVIDRIVLNILIGNGDAHLKNWAVSYPDGKNAVLSPAYDVLPTILYLPEDDLGLKLGGTRIFAEITPKNFRRLGERSGFGGEAAEMRAKDAVEKLMQRWDLLADHLTKENYDRLTRRLLTLPLSGGKNLVV